MSRGPPPVPSALLQLRNSPIAKKRAREGEPTPTIGAPRRPMWLVGEGRKHWERMLPMLKAMGVLTKVDGGALARYCDHYRLWHEARQWIDDHGSQYAIRGKDKIDPKTGREIPGDVKCFMPYPAVTEYHRHSQAMSKMEMQFGLTPASRARIRVEKPLEESEFVNLGIAK